MPTPRPLAGQRAGTQPHQRRAGQGEHRATRRERPPAAARQPSEQQRTHQSSGEQEKEHRAQSI